MMHQLLSTDRAMRVSFEIGWTAEMIGQGRFSLRVNSVARPQNETRARDPPHLVRVEIVVPWKILEAFRVFMAAEAGAMDQGSLKGKVVMVTGASSGIGREICLDLAAAGCKIVAAARRVDRLKSLCDEINGSSNTVQAVVVELDVSRKSPAIEAAVHDAWNAFGRIDALVNNAGVRGTLSHNDS
ncbi:hypothetical protein BHM03_00047630 [Ensete ventricosum]|nr:hypothetical protein BHM03_00047630 [Ensete ventricosum]